jgi:DNA-binding NtrC family response regulator
MSQFGFPFLGHSESLTRFLGDLKVVASSQASILLCGGSGVGKTSASRAIHAQSGRSAGPFVPVHLAALSESLIEGALFGHERGAFTDAHRARKGLFERASGGTLVLDDIDLLSRDVQVKLLRVLQEKVVEPLGSEISIPVDFRVICTTNKDLRAEVEAGRFREDLYFRMAVVVMEVPALRLRMDDVEELALDLIQRVAKRSNVVERSLSKEALEALLAHMWPGNVRELENAMERVLVLTQRGAGLEIGAEELGFLSEATEGVPEEIGRMALAHGLTIDDLTLVMMDLALAEQRGNVSAAARAVGITRRAFEYRSARREDDAAKEQE